MIKKSVLSMSYNSDNTSKDSFFKIGNSYNSDVLNQKNINSFFSNNKKNKRKIENLLDSSLAKAFNTNRLIKNKIILQNFSSPTLNNYKSTNIHKIFNKSNYKKDTESHKNKKMNKIHTSKYRNLNNSQKSKQPLFQIKSKKNMETSLKFIRKKKILSESMSFRKNEDFNNKIICTSNINLLSENSERMDNKKFKKYCLSNSCIIENRNNNSIEKNRILTKDINKHKINSNRKVKLFHDNSSNKNERNKNSLCKLINNTKIYNEKKKNNKTKNIISHKKYKKIIAKDNVVKLYSSRQFSPYYKYFEQYNTKLITNKIKKIKGLIEKNKNILKNTHNLKSKLSEPKNNNKNIIKSVKKENIDNKITVNLNSKNSKIKQKIEINSYMKIDTTISPNSSLVTKTPESSKLICSKKTNNGKNTSSTKNIYKFRNKKNGGHLPGSLSCKNSCHSKSSIKNNNTNKTNYINSNNLVTSESTELNNIVNVMNNKLQQFKANNSFYLSEKNNKFISPDGPEDFHFRFVELYKLNKLFYEKLKSKFIDIDLNNNEKNNNVKENDDECSGKYEFEENFEGYEDNVPYI